MVAVLKNELKIFGDPYARIEILIDHVCEILIDEVLVSKCSLMLNLLPFYGIRQNRTDKAGCTSTHKKG